MSKKSTEIGVGKKVLASALSAAMVVAFAPAVAMADGSEDIAVQTASDTDTQLPAAEKGVITLKNDVTITSWPEIAQEGNLTIDLAGHTLTYDGTASWTLSNKQKLTIANGTLLAKKIH